MPARGAVRTKAEAWELFRIGADGSWNQAAGRSTAHADGRFPVAAFDQFMKQGIPRWTSNDVAIQAAYTELARQYGPWTIVAHSQGCNFAFGMALAHPGMVKAIVAVEPSGFPEPSLHRLETLRAISTVRAGMTWRGALSGYVSSRGSTLTAMRCERQVCRWTSWICPPAVLPETPICP